MVPRIRWRLSTGLAGLVMASLAISGASLAAESPVSCVDIADPDARLACFDRQFGNMDKTEDVPQAPEPPVVPESTAPAVIETAPVTQRPAADPEPPAAPAAPASRSSEAPITAQAGKARAPERRSGGLFARKAKVNIAAQIAAVRAREQQKMVFLLDNEEVWMQTAPRLLPIKKGDQIRIKSTLFGGYVLRTSSGTSTRVTRIK